MEILLEHIIPSLIGILGIGITVLITWLFKKAIDLVNIVLIEKALKIAKKTTNDVVISVFAQMKEDFKHYTDDGKLEREDIEAIKNNAIEKIMDELPILVKKLIGLFEDNFEDLVGDWVEDLIEISDLAELEKKA